MIAMAQRRPRLWWRVGAVTAGAVAIWLAIDELATVLFGAEYDRAGHVVRALAATFLTVPMVVAARRLLDRRPWPMLSWRVRWRGLLLGAVCYLVPAGLAVGGAVLSGRVQIRVQVGIPELLLVVAGLLVLVLLYEAYPEELIFRGYLYRNLSAEFAPWLAVFVQAVLFAAFGSILWLTTGVGWETVLARFGIFFGVAVVLGCLRTITGNMWACIGFHVAYQTSQQLIGPSWRQVHITDPQLVEQVVLGLVPVSLALPLLLLLHRAPTDWRTPRADPDPTATVTRNP